MLISSGGCAPYRHTDYLVKQTALVSTLRRGLIETTDITLCSPANHPTPQDFNSPKPDVTTMRRNITDFLWYVRRNIADFLWYLIICILLIASAYLLYLVYFSYSKYRIDLSQGPDYKDMNRNLLEIAFYLGNTLVAIIAAFSIIYVRTQIKHAAESSRASIYMEINNRFNNPTTRYSYRKIVSFIDSYDTGKLPNESSVGQYANRILLEYYKAHVTTAKSLSADETEYSRTIAILPFFEDIGVMVARRYVRKEDIFDFIGSVIIRSEDVLKDHIKWIRKNRTDPKEYPKGDPHVFANALTLMKQAQRAKSQGAIHSFNEGYYLIEK